MTRKQYLIIALAALLVLFIGFSVFIYCNYRAMQDFRLYHVSPTQAAQAMKDDHFYSSYKENALVIKGEINGITKSRAHTSIQLKTSSTYKLNCNLNPANNSLRLGEKVTIVGIAATAERQPNGVLFTDCTTL